MAKTKKDFEIVGSSIADKYMRQNIAEFLNRVTFNDVYAKVVQEVKNNFDRINMYNLLKAVRNNGKKGIQK